jgi:hypothetical protein
MPILDYQHRVPRRRASLRGKIVAVAVALVPLVMFAMLMYVMLVRPW